MTPRIRPPYLSMLQKARADASRHIHIMEDDEVFVPKLHRLPAGADPMALPHEFFRAGDAA